MTRALALALYRGLLKWSRTHTGIPVGLRAGDLYAVAPLAQALPDLELDDSSTVERLARMSFKLDRRLQGEDASLALERALLTLRTLNTQYAEAVRLMRETRAERSNREGVAFDVGSVFVHKKYGYRGLVYGWDRECTRDEEWVREAGVDPRQPFYYVLPDEIDCSRLFQQPLSTRYVAQDNMLRLPRGERIVHRAVNHYFPSFSPSLGRYIPCAKLQYEYPGDYAAEDGDCAAADANLLLHEEGGGGGRGGRGRRRAGPFKPVNRGPPEGGEQEAVI